MIRDFIYKMKPKLRWLWLGILLITIAGFAAVAKSASLAGPTQGALTQISTGAEARNGGKVDPIKAYKTKQKKEIRRKFAQEALAQGPSEQQIEDAIGSIDFVTLSDDSETLSIEAPRAWEDIESGPWIYQGEEVGSYIAAATDLGIFERSFDAPGLFFGVSSTLLDTLGEKKLIKLEQQRVKEIDKNCRAKSGIEYKSPFTSGHYYPYDRCKNKTEHLYFLAVTSPPDKKYVVVLRINAPNQSSYAIAQGILESFHVEGTPGVDEHHDD